MTPKTCFCSSSKTGCSRHGPAAAQQWAPEGDAGALLVALSCVVKHNVHDHLDASRMAVAYQALEVLAGSTAWRALRCTLELQPTASDDLVLCWLCSVARTAEQDWLRLFHTSCYASSWQGFELQGLAICLHKRRKCRQQSCMSHKSPNARQHLTWATDELYLAMGALKAAVE